MSFENAPDALSEHTPNQNIGVKHQSFPRHAGYFDFRLLSRLAR
jgi:hypothetical protein